MLRIKLQGVVRKLPKRDSSNLSEYELESHLPHQNIMLNILGRTKEEQDSIDRELKERGNLWGKIGILYDYKYREEEIEEVED